MRGSVQRKVERSGEKRKGRIVIDQKVIVTILKLNMEGM